MVEELHIRQPPGYAWLEDEPTYNPAVHLQLERPERTWSLTDFGYSEQQLHFFHFPLAITSPFRMLSAEGLAAMRATVQRLAAHASSSNRIANFVRGGVYRSRFLRDFCQCQVISDFVGDLAGAPILPHTMPLYQGHINLMPAEQARDVDKWHTDTVALDYVLMLTDPKTFEGGTFEYIPMTKEAAISSLSSPKKYESETIKVAYPEAGYAVLQQGNMVVHRATRVTQGTERTALVQSYVPADLDRYDVSRLNDCRPIDPPEVLYTEWARHKAHLSRRKLGRLIDELDFTEDREDICRQLREAIFDVERAIVEILDTSPVQLTHYGRDGLTNR